MPFSFTVQSHTAFKLYYTFLLMSLMLSPMRSFLLDRQLFASAIASRKIMSGLSTLSRSASTTLHGSKNPNSNSIFCNRELNMQQIEAIGFDLDYTLAAYTADFDHLSFDCAANKLVSQLGYPANILSLRFEEGMCTRGCIVDKQRGNLLKLDKHRYVRSVQHGLSPLTRDQRKAVYRDSYQESERFSGPDFVSIDTPFSLVDVSLFAQLVHLRDSAVRGEEVSFWQGKSYSGLWQDIRRSVDRSHRDGSIKNAVAADPAKYIQYDDKLISMLEGFRRAGKKVFLLTNSLWEYTHVVMNYLEGGKTRAADRDFAWLRLFDAVVVGGNKPSFLLEESLPVYAVDPLEGSLRNLEDISTLLRRQQEASNLAAEKTLVLQGGDQRLLLRLLAVSATDRLLYVGDHVYSDVLRSKRSLGWRTCLIVPELEQEMASHHRLRTERESLLTMRRDQSLQESLLDELELQLLQLQMSLRDLSASVGGGDPHQTETLQTQIEVLETLVKSRRLELKQQTAALATRLAAFNAGFDGRWGQLLRAGWQESRLAAQVRDHACIFTSKASNLGAMSPQRPLRPSELDLAPHDLALLYHHY